MQHQLSVNGKRDHFTRADLRQVAKEMNVRRADELVDEILAQVAHWPAFAAAAGVAEGRVAEIGAAHRQLR